MILSMNFSVIFSLDIYVEDDLLKHLNLFDQRFKGQKVYMIFTNTGATIEKKKKL